MFQSTDKKYTLYIHVSIRNVSKLKNNKKGRKRKFYLIFKKIYYKEIMKKNYIRIWEHRKKLEFLFVEYYLLFKINNIQHLIYYVGILYRWAIKKKWKKKLLKAYTHTDDETLNNYYTNKGKRYWNVIKC